LFSEYDYIAYYDLDLGRGDVVINELYLGSPWLEKKNRK